MPRLSEVKLTEIDWTPAMAVRARQDHGIEEEYNDKIQSGEDLFDVPDPVMIFRDRSGKLWGADGKKRAVACELAGRETVRAVVKDMERSDGMDPWIYAAGSNTTHGQPRSDADLRATVSAVLAQPDLASKSTKWLSDILKIGEHRLEKLRMSLGDSQETRTDKRGRKRKAKTGKKKAEREPGEEDTEAKTEPGQANGTPVFSIRDFNQAIGRVHFELNRLLHTFGLERTNRQGGKTITPTPEHQAIVRLLTEAKTATMKWYEGLKRAQKEKVGANG